MNSIVVFYSFSGNTRKVAHFLSEYLAQKGPVAVIELLALDESNKFLAQAGRAFKHTRAKLGSVNFDLSKYDLVCFGTPVWAFGPAPAMNTYLDKCSGVENKQAVLFTTYGSGAGNSRCLNYMQEILSRKGAKDFQRFSIQQFKVNDKEFVLQNIARL
jgi:flavodoxin